MKKVFIAGATGSMGRQVVQLVNQQPDYQLVGIMAPSAKKSKQFDPTIARFTNLAAIDLTADIWIDFTVPQTVFENTKFALTHQMRPIIGTSGLSAKQTQELQQIAKENKIGGIIAPNFGLSAVLLMKFAQEAAKYFPQAEIIEMHHVDKLDAPSATAIATARLIAASRKKSPNPQPDHQAGARGANYDGIPVHSVRLPGYVAHEQVLFGGPGEALTIRQDSFDRSSFMQGVKVALDHIMDLSELVIGLEQIL